MGMGVTAHCPEQGALAAVIVAVRVKPRVPRWGSAWLGLVSFDLREPSAWPSSLWSDRVFSPRYQVLWRGHWL